MWAAATPPQVCFEYEPEEGLEFYELISHLPGECGRAKWAQSRAEEAGGTAAARTGLPACQGAPHPGRRSAARSCTQNLRDCSRFPLLLVHPRGGAPTRRRSSPPADKSNSYLTPALAPLTKNT